MDNYSEGLDQQNFTFINAIKVSLVRRYDEHNQHRTTIKSPLLDSFITPIVMNDIFGPQGAPLCTVDLAG